jgi:hypothetical protein
LHLSLDLACNLDLVIQTSFFAQSCEERCVLDHYGNLASKHTQSLAVEMEERPATIQIEDGKQFALASCDGRIE